MKQTLARECLFHGFHEAWLGWSIVNLPDSY
jgi:hypothetical protein